MKYNLLELTQRILGSMESDEVSSVSETPESLDVANIIKECYYDIVGHGNLAEHEGPFKLDSSGDNLKPVLMTIPSYVVRMDWLKYNFETLASPDYTHLRLVDLDEYLHLQGGMDQSDPTILTMTQNIGGTDFVFRYRNDRYPNYFTLIDDHYVVFDSFDSEVEATLSQVRTMAYGLIAPTFVMEDSFIPDLDHRQFQLLLQDAKATAHVELKQQQNPKAEQKYRRNLILSQKTKHDNDPRTSKQKAQTMGRGRRR